MGQESKSIAKKLLFVAQMRKKISRFIQETVVLSH
jgi:hypothetical protein